MILALVLVLLILPFVDHLKNTILVSFSQLAVDLSGFLGVSHDDFIKDELSDNVLVDGVLLELKVVILDRFSFDDLVIILRIVELLKEWMLKHLLCADPVGRIEGKQFADQVDGVWRSVWNQFLKCLS